MTIFCLRGYNEDKILLEFKEDQGFPHKNELDGGYGISCSLQIVAGGCQARADKYYSSTSALSKFLVELKETYDKLGGEAEYIVMYEYNLSFKVLMSSVGHARIIGQFIDNNILEGNILRNALDFEIATDQTYLVDAIKSLESFLKKYE